LGSRAVNYDKIEMKEKIEMKVSYSPSISGARTDNGELYMHPTTVQDGKDLSI